MEKDNFNQERIRELIRRMVSCEDTTHDDEEAYQQQAFNELLDMGLTPERVREMVLEASCEDLLCYLDPLLLGC